MSGVLKYLPHLFECDTTEPFDELGERSAIFEILEQRGHGHARTAKHPSAAKHAGTRFDR